MEFYLIWRERKMNRDRYDLPLTTVSDRAAALYRDGVDRMLSAWDGAANAFDAAIAEDPAFAIAHIARARIHQMNMEVTEGGAGAAICGDSNPARTPARRDHGFSHRGAAQSRVERRRAAP